MPSISEPPPSPRARLRDPRPVKMRAERLPSPQRPGRLSPLAAGEDDSGDAIFPTGDDVATTLRFAGSAPDLSAGGWSKEAEAVESTSNDTAGSTSNGIANGERSHGDHAEGGDHGLARLNEDQAAAPGRPGRGSQSRAARSARRCARSRGAGAGGREPARPLGLSTAFPQKAARHRKTARATLRKERPNVHRRRRALPPSEPFVHLSKTRGAGHAPCRQRESPRREPA